MQRLPARMDDWMMLRVRLPKRLLYPFFLPLANVMVPILGRPEVNVPVLSNNARFTLDSDSITSPPLAIAPDLEANERLAACGTGEASNSAHGQATTHNNRMIFQSAPGLQPMLRLHQSELQEPIVR